MRAKRSWVALSLFGFAYASATVAEARWSSLGGGFARAGQSQDVGPLSGEVRWRFEIDAPVIGSVTVGSAGHIHIACEDGKLYTLDSKGKVQWVLDVNSPLLSAPSIGPDGSLYVGCKSGKVYGVAPDGRLRWSFATGGAVYSSPAVGTKGDIYVGSTDPTLYALNPADGSVKWSCRFPDTSKDPNTDGWPFASPVVAEDGTIYQTLLYDRHLYAIEPADGAIRWSVEFPDSGIPVTSNLTIPADVTAGPSLSSVPTARSTRVSTTGTSMRSIPRGRSNGPSRSARSADSRWSSTGPARSTPPATTGSCTWWAPTARNWLASRPAAGWPSRLSRPTAF